MAEKIPVDMALYSKIATEAAEQYTIPNTQTRCLTHRKHKEAFKDRYGVVDAYLYICTKSVFKVYYGCIETRGI